MRKNLSTLHGLGYTGLSGATEDLTLIKNYYAEVLIPAKIEYAKGMGLTWDGAIWWSLFNFELGQAASMKWNSNAFVKYWGDWLDFYKCLNNKNGEYSSNWKKVSRINKLLDRANARRVKTTEKLVDPQSGLMIKDESLFAKGKITYRLASGNNDDKTKDWGKIHDMILIGDADYKTLVDIGRKNKSDESATTFYSTLQNLSLNMLNPIPESSNVWNIYLTPPTIDSNGKWKTVLCPWYWNTLMPIVKMGALMRGSDWGKAKPSADFISFMNTYDEELFMGLLNGYEEKFKAKYPAFTNRDDILSTSVFDNMPLSNSITADNIKRNESMDSLEGDAGNPEIDPDFDKEEKKLSGSGKALWWALGGVAILGVGGAIYYNRKKQQEQEMMWNQQPPQGMQGSNRVPYGR